MISSDGCDEEYPTQYDVYNYGLYLLDNELKDNDSQGKGLSKYPEMPRSHRDWDSLLKSPVLQGYMDYDPIIEQELARTATATFTEDQSL